MEEGSMIMSTAKISLELSKDDFIQIYKACEDRATRLDALQNKSQDEDVIADAGNDLIEINMVKRFLKAKADELWGPSGWTTSEEFL
jgi:hypothetical protein